MTYSALSTPQAWIKASCVKSSHDLCYARKLEASELSTKNLHPIYNSCKLLFDFRESIKFNLSSDG